MLWASAAEGERFSSKIREMQRIVKDVTPEELEASKKVFEKASGRG